MTLVPIFHAGSSEALCAGYAEKIDESFIDAIPYLQDDMGIAVTIIAMGHILGFKVLAEGLETAAQLDLLREQHCDSYQGYINSPSRTGRSVC